jgi:hypothetical protein
MDTGDKYEKLLASGYDELDDLLAVNVVLMGVRDLYAHFSSDTEINESENGRAILDALRAWGIDVRAVRDQLIWKMINRL